ncbi:MAG: hypothetical protein JXR68_12100 [Bacteroidales bacterium]|nr:hypothetical protein [Bacteroidales bacterium]
MKAPKKPKFAKAPKMPKDAASAQTWSNYERKLKEVEQKNKKLGDEYKKAQKVYDAEKKRRSKIKELAKSGLGKI